MTPAAPVAIDPNVWSGRVSQEVFFGPGWRSCINVSGLWLERVMAKAIELAAEMIRANAGFHSDQAWRHIRKSCLNLATRPFLPQNDRAPLVAANNVERVLAHAKSSWKNPDLNDHDRPSITVAAKLLRH